MRAVLNVGGGSKAIPIPSHFDGWRHDLLDIDPAGKPDVLADARELELLPPATYDAIYCSHNLEHYHRHEAAKVVRGFCHLLKPEGFAQILVPNLMAVMQHALANNLDVDDLLYESDAGPILLRDVVYGFHVEIERNNNEFFAHKTCFSVKSLPQFMAQNGFPVGGAVAHAQWQIYGCFFKQPPSDELCKLLKITPA